jgi:SAM-dependent methyltransferase
LSPETKTEAVTETVKPVGTAKSPFTPEGVRDYERRRYRGLDQRLVQAREARIVRKYFKAMERRADGQGTSLRGESAPPGKVQGFSRRGEGTAGGLILDLPCGYGRFSPLLIKSGLKLINSDLSFEMVRRADEKSLRPGVAADAKNGLPFRAGAFGAVFSMRFFHHIHNPAERRAVLAEFARVSSDWAVVSYYRSNALHKAQRAVRRLRKKSPRRIRMIEGGTFSAEAKDAGFEIIRDTPLFRGLHAARIALLKKAAAC